MLRAFPSTTAIGVIGIVGVLFIGLILVAGSGNQAGRDVLVVIPMGAAQSPVGASAAARLPSQISLPAGRGIIVRNDDQATHYVFDVAIGPGQTYQRTFSQAGRYTMSAELSCSVAGRQKQVVTIDVWGR